MLAALDVTVMAVVYTWIRDRHILVGVWHMRAVVKLHRCMLTAYALVGGLCRGSIIRHMYVMCSDICVRFV